MAKDRAAERLNSRYCNALPDGIKTLDEALGEIAESGRIGRPVFVRWTATVAGGDNGHRMAADVSCLTVVWTWPRGEAALFASGPAAADANFTVGVTLIGSRGAA